MLTLIDPSLVIKDILANLGLPATMISWLSTVIMVFIVGILAWLADIISKAIILKVVTVWVKRSKSEYDDKFLETKVFHRLSHLVPALVVYYMASWALKNNVFWLTFVHKTTAIYIVIFSILVVNSFIEAWYRIYLMLPISQGRSIKGYAQLLKIISGVIGSLIVVSVVFRLDIGKIVTGLGAVAAVLILVFKDTILGLVASVQLSSNKMLRLGDWITLSGKNIDGTVIDMSLHTVKIRNFDNTISTVPTYTLVSDSFQNWKGMEESGVRRIKRSLLIDVRSITLLDAELVLQLKKMPLMDEFLKLNSAGIDSIMKGESTALTNLGAFRAYFKAYLYQHPFIDSGQSLIVRNLDPTDNGMPVELYAFCKTNQWVPYEEIQSAIFDYVFAVIGKFNLTVFQSPSGADFANSNKKLI
jgi:miniconductance mechanosensitive channel